MTSKQRSTTRGKSPERAGGSVISNTLTMTETAMTAGHMYEYHMAEELESGSSRNVHVTCAQLLGRTFRIICDIGDRFDSRLAHVVLRFIKHAEGRLLSVGAVTEPVRLRKKIGWSRVLASASSLAPNGVPAQDPVLLRSAQCAAIQEASGNCASIASAMPRLGALDGGTAGVGCWGGTAVCGCATCAFCKLEFKCSMPPPRSTARICSLLSMSDNCFESLSSTVPRSCCIVGPPAETPAGAPALGRASEVMV
mmetsp:Transcript_95340/g.278755  ORF Transcript_95340/g.278755 Transcript_95340/m.278755 type:complete len:253 (-) Transcript_95340:75-833(-)